MSKLKQVISLTVAVFFAVIIIACSIWFIYVVTHNNNVRNEAMTSSNSTKTRTHTFEHSDGFEGRMGPTQKCGELTSGDRIYNGNATKLFEFPWMALLAYQTGSTVVFMCAGTLITDQFVLTAAHCTARSDIQLNFVRLGEHNIDTDPDCEKTELGELSCSEGVQDIDIEQILPHPDFNFKTFENDIALIKLVKRADLNPENVNTICLPLTKDLWQTNLKNVILSGWGLTEHGSPNALMLKTQLPVVPNEQCKVYKNVNITNRHICVGGAKSSSCSGDSGGPIMYVPPESVRYYQFGVISAGSLICGGGGLPGIHTKIFDYLDWIYEYVGNEVNQ